MPFLEKNLRNFEIYEKLRIFQILQILKIYFENFKKKFTTFWKKISLFPKSEIFIFFLYLWKKKSHFLKNHAKSSKIFRNFEISQKLRIFQILKIKFQIYRKFPKKNYQV